MESIVQRIKKIADREGVSVTAFEAKIGASRGVLSRALANGTDIHSKWLGNVVEKYPRYSAEWLLSGKGEMIVPEVMKDFDVPYETSQDLIAALRKVIESQEVTIKAQEITIAALRAQIG